MYSSSAVPFAMRIGVGLETSSQSHAPAARSPGPKMGAARRIHGSWSEAAVAMPMRLVVRSPWLGSTLAVQFGWVPFQFSWVPV